MKQQASPTPHLFYVVDWLPPDFGAVGQYGLIFSRDLAAAGRQVHLFGLTTGEAGTQTERIDGAGLLTITRITVPAYDRTRYASRLAWLVRANFRLIAALMRHRYSRGSEIIFTGAPPFMLFFVIFLKYLRGAKLTYRITDFYPEVLIAEFGRTSLPLKLFERFTWFVRRRIDKFQALGEDQRNLLITGGVRPERIVIKRDISPIHITGHETPAAPPGSLRGHAVMLYSGNYAVAHDTDTVVGGLIRHYRAGNGRFGLWLNATGKNVELVERKLRNAGIPVASTPPGPIEQLPSLLAAADVHLITLRTPFSGIVLPSKVYACIGSRRPILFVGPESSDVHQLCMAAPIRYERVEPGDVDGFAAALERFYTCMALTESID